MSSLFSNSKFVRLPSRPSSRSNSPQPPSAPSTSSSLSWDQLFADAVEEYKKQTGKELPIYTQLTDLSAEKVINVLEERARGFDKVRRGGAKVELMRKLKPVVDVVLSVSDVLGKAAALPYPPAAAIFSAVGVLLQGTKNVSQSYDALVDLFDCLRSFLERVRVYLECSPKSTIDMKGVLVKMLAATLSVLAIATKEINKGRLRKYGEALLGDTSIQDALQRLDRITGEEARMVAVQGLEVVCGLMTNMESVMKNGKDSKEGITCALAKMGGVQEDIKQVKNDVHDVKRVVLDEKLYQWLSPPDPSTNYNDAIRSHSEDTGAWLFGEEEYMKWKEGGSFLWIYGKPGSGKSVLCSAIIQDLRSQQNCAPAPYYYFDFADPRKQDLNGFLSSLVVQICERAEQFHATLAQLYARHSKEKPADSDLIDLLKLVLSTAGRTYIIVDALDECPGPGLHSKRYAVLRALQGLAGLKNENLRLCVTSRPEVDIQDVLNPLASHRISLDESGGHQRDITTYTRSMVKNDGVFKKWGDKDKDFIIEGLVKKANGMFRWVECQLQFLSRCSSRKQLAKVLEDLPKTLYETYERILQQIDQSPCREDAHRVLQWLVFAARPMTLKEVVDVLAVDLDAEHPLFEIVNRMPEPRDVLAACSSLVVLRESNMRLELAHFSVQQYLFDTAIDRPRLTISEATLAHEFIARTCLTYLLQFTDPLDESVLKLFPLASYAAEFWIHHVQRTNIEPLLDMILQLLEYCHEAYINWIRIYDVDRYIHATDFSRTRSSVAHPVYYVALAGLHMVLEKLIGEGADVNAEGGLHGSALQQASSRGHVAVVQLLLEHGADVNAQCGLYGGALWTASCGGHLAVVQLLLEHGADINAQRGKYGSALHAASFRGHVAVVQLLLKHGADVHAQRGRYGNALQAASYGGHLAVVQLLLEHGADVNAQGGYHGSALQQASSRGHVAVVRLLLEHGANANAQGGNYGSALQQALSEGHLAVVQLLLEHGADVNARGGFSGNALQQASSRGHVAVVRLLLEHGADVNAQCSLYGSALQQALSGGHLAVVRLLLEHGADINAQHSGYGNALQAASYDGDSAIVELLLEYGADVNAHCGEYGSVLQTASYGGHLAVVQLLLEHGADVNAQGGYHGSALQAASSSGHLTVVQLLLEHGADVHAQGGEYGGALEAALSGGHVTIVRLLLGKGATTNMPVDRYGSACIMISDVHS